LACAVAAIAGVGVAGAIPAAATSGISVSVVAVPGGGTVQDALTQGPDGQEWFILRSGGSYALEEASASGTLGAGSFSPLSATGLTDPQRFVGLVSADGLVWALGNSSSLFAINATGSSAPAAVADPAASDLRDVTLGPDGNLWATDAADHIDRFTIAASGAASVQQFTTSTGSPVPAYAITTAGSFLFWGDGSGYPWYTVPVSGTPVGPYPATMVSESPHSVIADAGSLWAVGFGAAGQDKIEKLSASPPYGVSATFGTGAGIPAGADITSITVGPDGDLWFPEAGVDEVGQLTR
jgi:hypothetical protein